MEQNITQSAEAGNQGDALTLPQNGAQTNKALSTAEKLKLEWLRALRAELEPKALRVRKRLKLCVENNIFLDSHTIGTKESDVLNTYLVVCLEIISLEKREADEVRA